MSTLYVLTALMGVVSIVGNIYLAYKLIKITREKSKETASKNTRIN